MTNENKNDIGYSGGSKIRYTGNTDPEFDLLEFVYLDGHKRGQIGFCASQAQRDANTSQAQKEFRDQQARFRRLHEIVETRKERRP